SIFSSSLHHPTVHSFPTRRSSDLTFSSTAVHAVHLPGQVKAGDRLDDFDLLALIGQGAFAQVFLARQQSLQRLVALKVSADRGRSEEHTSELQSRFDLVCRLLLEK